MPAYKVTDPATGQTLRLTGDSPPTEAELTQVFSSLGGGGTASALPPKEEPKKTLPRYVRPALEMGGMLAGGLVAAPSAAISGPAGPAAGAGLGYAMGRQAANYLEEKAGLRQPEGVQGRLVEAAKDIPMGVAMDLGGSLIMKGMQGAGKLIMPTAEKIYASALKAPLTKKWTSVLPGKELSARQTAIRAGLDARVSPSEFGVAKVAQLERQTRGMVDDIINAGAARGDMVKTDDLINSGLQRAYARAAKSSDPVGAKQIVDDIAEKFRAHGPEIPTNTLNQIKRQIYDEVKWGGAEQTALTSQLNTMGKKGIAHEAMTQLETAYPQIAALNKQDAAYINLKDIIERASARMQNNDIVGLGAKALSVRSIPMAIFEYTVGHPMVKSQLAFALNAAAKAQGNTTGRLASYGIGKKLTDLTGEGNLIAPERRMP